MSKKRISKAVDARTALKSTAAEGYKLYKELLGKLTERGAKDIYKNTFVDYLMELERNEVYDLPSRKLQAKAIKDIATKMAYQSAHVLTMEEAANYQSAILRLLTEFPDDEDLQELSKLSLKEIRYDTSKVSDVYLILQRYGLTKREAGL